MFKIASPLAPALTFTTFKFRDREAKQIQRQMGVPAEWVAGQLAWAGGDPAQLVPFPCGLCSSLGTLATGLHFVCGTHSGEH